MSCKLARHRRKRANVKYSIRAKVEGLLFLDEPNSSVIAEADGVVFELTSDSQRRIHSVSVCLQVPPEAAKRMHASFGPKPSDPNCAPPLTIDVDPQVDDAAQRHLQTIESVMSFMAQNHPLVRIRWSEGALSLVPENDEEQKRVQVEGFQISTSFPRLPTIVRLDFFQDVVSRASRYGDLVEPMAFLREGTNREADGDFIRAFYSYYFVLEGLYAQGRSNEHGVLAAFAKSVILTNVCTAVLNSFFRPGGPTDEDVKKLAPLLAAQKCDMTVEGLQRFLVRMRNQLHHFSRKSTRAQPHPFNQAAFTSVAHLAGFVATVALRLEQLKIDQGMASLGAENLRPPIQGDPGDPKCSGANANASEEQR